MALLEALISASAMMDSGESLTNFVQGDLSYQIIY